MLSADGADLVESYSEDVGRLVRRSMLDAIPDGEPHRWLYRVARVYPSRPGKALRPALCVATSRAFGGGDGQILPVAVAIELLHNAFLVHDDIVDGSERRRGRPTLPAEFGVGLALNAGDALAVLSNQILRRHAACMEVDLADRVLHEFDAMALRTLEGQATELGWRRDGVEELEPEDYLDLIMHKTCWYTTVHPLRVGALIGSAGSADLGPMARFGFYLGAAFQIQDDLLNLLGTEREYGKEIDGDLYEGKRTLPLIHLLRNVRGGDRQTLDSYLRLERSERTAGMVSEIRGLLNDYGSIAFAAAYARGIAGAALDAFETAFAPANPGPDRDFVRAAVPYMLDRRA
ncbi:MAG TPA: polyprenyl synthetase family protein [Solirubrobacteraceae bacterium]|nr:polyprenyl synthetase family protein [Solirubrobacteraceae bacterium]